MKQWWMQPYKWAEWQSVITILYYIFLFFFLLRMTRKDPPIRVCKVADMDGVVRVFGPYLIRFKWGRHRNRQGVVVITPQHHHIEQGTSIEAASWMHWHLASTYTEFPWMRTNLYGQWGAAVSSRLINIVFLRIISMAQFSGRFRWWDN